MTNRLVSALCMYHTSKSWTFCRQLKCPHTSDANSPFLSELQYYKAVVFGVRCSYDNVLCLEFLSLPGFRKGNWIWILEAWNNSDVVFLYLGLFEVGIWICRLLFQLDALHWETPARPGNANSLVLANALFVWTLVTHIKLFGVWTSYQQVPFVAAGIVGIQNLGETLLPPGV